MVYEHRSGTGVYLAAAANAQKAVALNTPIQSGVSPIKDCNQCGKCCIKYANGGLSATSEEIDWWESNRPDIASYVRYENGVGKIWADPISGQKLKSCPWLQQDPSSLRYRCNIYHERPEDCRHYPVNISQMVLDECEMLEVRDLSDTDRAQRSLDRLMLFSRPASR